jgi:hypothetical protein
MAVFSPRDLCVENNRDEDSKQQFELHERSCALHLQQVRTGKRNPCVTKPRPQSDRLLDQDCNETLDYGVTNLEQLVWSRFVISFLQHSTSCILGYPASAGERPLEARGCAVMVKQSQCNLPMLDFDKLGKMCHSQKTAAVEDLTAFRLAVVARHRFCASHRCFGRRARVEPETTAISSRITRQPRSFRRILPEAPQ